MVKIFFLTPDDVFPIISIQIINPMLPAGFPPSHTILTIREKTIYVTLCRFLITLLQCQGYARNYTLLFLFTRS